MWLNFKINPPFDYRTAIHGKMECDPDIGFICYKFPNRPSTMNSGPFVSEYPHEFKDGSFDGYNENQPYEEDRIEILAWLPIHVASAAMLDSAKEFLGL